MVVGLLQEGNMLNQISIEVDITLTLKGHLHLEAKAVKKQSDSKMSFRLNKCNLEN